MLEKELLYLLNFHNLKNLSFYSFTKKVVVFLVFNSTPSSFTSTSNEVKVPIFFSKLTFKEKIALSFKDILPATIPFFKNSIFVFKLAS